VRRLLGLLSVGLALAALLFLASVWTYASLHLLETRVPGLGNFEETVRALPRDGDGKFRFAVMGDPEENPAIFRGLMKQASRMGAAFVVITGDIVDLPRPAGFGFFNYVYRALGSEALPTFSCVGNHDESPNDLFEKYLGPEEFSFLYQGSIFIFVDNNDPGRYARCESYVRQEIERHRGRADHVFIVVHKPIVEYRRDGGELQDFRSTGGYLYRILDSEKVDAVLAGHYHGYLREEYKDTLLLVTGGAGSRLHGPGGFHMVLIDVSPRGIKDTKVMAEDLGSLWDRLSYRVVVSVYSALFGRWWPPVVWAMISGLLLVLGLVLLRARPARGKGVCDGASNPDGNVERLGGGPGVQRGGQPPPAVESPPPRVGRSRS